MRLPLQHYGLLILLMMGVRPASLIAQEKLQSERQDTVSQARGILSLFRYGASIPIGTFATIASSGVSGQFGFQYEIDSRVSALFTFDMDSHNFESASTPPNLNVKAQVGLTTFLLHTRYHVNATALSPFASVGIGGCLVSSPRILLQTDGIRSDFEINTQSNLHFAAQLSAGADYTLTPAMIVYVEASYLVVPAETQFVSSPLQIGFFGVGMRAPLF